MVEVRPKPNLYGHVYCAAYGGVIDYHRESDCWRGMKKETERTTRKREYMYVFCALILKSPNTMSMLFVCNK